MPPRKKHWIPEHLVSFLRMPVPDEFVQQIERESSAALEMAQRAREESLTPDNTGQHKTDAKP